MKNNPKNHLQNLKTWLIGGDIRTWRRKALICFAAIFGMGFFLSFLILTQYGTDPYTFMNLSLSEMLRGRGLRFMTLGTWQLILNIAMLLFVIWKNPRLIGIGTIFNMVLIGYYADFFTWAWRKLLPETLFTVLPQRAVVFGLALLGFVLSAAVYMNCEVGLSPYDATGKILADALRRVPFFLVRIAYDALAVLIGFLAEGHPTVGILLMTVLLGPFIQMVGRWMRPMFERMETNAGANPDAPGA